MKIQLAVAEFVETELEIPFGILFYQKDFIACHISGKRNIMFLGHFVGSRNIPFVLDWLQLELMMFVRFDRRQRLQFFAAAGNTGITCGGNEIFALWTAIKLSFFHISSD